MKKNTKILTSGIVSAVLLYSWVLWGDLVMTEGAIKFSDTILTYHGGFPGYTEYKSVIATRIEWLIIILLGLSILWLVINIISKEK